MKEKDLPHAKWKQISFVPEKGKLIKYSQIKSFSEDFIKRLPKNAKVTITGLNILRNTTLYSGYSGKFKTNTEYDEYLGKLNIDDPDKFNAFFNFTITVRIPDDGDDFDEEDE